MAKTIRIEKYRNEIRVYCPWSEGGPQACKSVHGARWNPKEKCWTYPLLWHVCLEIRKKIATPLKMEIELGEEMSAWAYAEKARQAEIPDVLGLEAVTLDRLPTLNPVLFGAASNRPFQTVGIKFGAMNREVLLADDPGLGKTMQTIGMFQEANVTGPILVVAPKAAALITWPNEIRRWTDNEEVFVFNADIPVGRRNDRIRTIFEKAWMHPDRRFWVIINPYWLRADVKLDNYGKYERDDAGFKITTSKLPSIFEKPWAGIVVDESHTTLAGSTGNAKKWSQQRRGLGAVQLKDKGIRVAISGTPFRGKPENLFGTLQWLRPDLYTSYWKWVGRHFVTENDGYSQVITGGILDEKAFYDEAASVMIRRTKDQVAPDLPPKMYGGEPLDKDDPDSVVGVWLPMDKKQETQYKAMAKAAEAEIEGGRLEAIGILAEMTRLKQFSNSAMSVVTDKNGEPKYHPVLPSNKVEWIEEFLSERDLVGQGAKGMSKLIVASQFTGFINMLGAHLSSIGVEFYKLTGETNAKERVRIVEEFQENPDSAKVFLLNTKAGGVSLTLDQADDVIICDETFIPDDQLQVEDRAHRLSRTDHNVTIWYLRSLGTIEESIGATTTEREKVCRGLIDGTRGVDFGKQFLSSSRQSLKD